MYLNKIKIKAIYVKPTANILNGTKLKALQTQEQPLDYFLEFLYCFES